MDLFKTAFSLLGNSGTLSTLLQPRATEGRQMPRSSSLNFVSSILAPFDSDMDGLLTSREAKKGAAKLDVGTAEIKDALKSLGIVDKKKIPITSLSEEVKRICIRKFKQEAFKKYFHHLDTDKSGTLSMTEVLQAIEEFGITAPKKYAQEMFDQVDTNGDGEIDIKEFLIFVNSVRGME